MPCLLQRLGQPSRERNVTRLDESLEDSDNLPPPDVLAAEIIEDLKAALEQFAEIQADLVMTRDLRGK